MAIHNREEPLDQWFTLLDKCSFNRYLRKTVSLMDRLAAESKSETKKDRGEIHVICTYQSSSYLIFCDGSQSRLLTCQL